MLSVAVRVREPPQHNMSVSLSTRAKHAVRVSAPSRRDQRLLDGDRGQWYTGREGRAKHGLRRTDTARRRRDRVEGAHEPCAARLLVSLDLDHAIYPELYRVAEGSVVG